MKRVNMNEYILKLIVGHAIDDITEKTYTHRTIEDLHREIQKSKIEKSYTGSLIDHRYSFFNYFNLCITAVS